MNIVYLILMLSPMLFQAFGVISLIVGNRRANAFRLVRNWMIAAAVVQFIYTLVILIPLDWEWLRLINLMVYIASACVYEFFYRNKAIEENIEMTREVEVTAKNLGLPYPTLLTHEQDEARIMSNIERTLKRGK